ncbi:MAG: aminotransferase class V-fold PLP-dependent enzyme [Chitinophagales bacterium]|nr:aminotransferase class V-fold PLP-dependent enzyme [Chitinophagales bacterium]MDW8393224.1 aminotransferase class V-fold PLP-dependent enzyme [Chitinophagales bacterium]
MLSRRTFLRSSSAAVAALGLPAFNGRITPEHIARASRLRRNLTPDELAQDESYWAMIRQAFTVSPTIINLNNGGVSPQPKHVQEMQYKYIQWSNEAPTYYMWRTLDMGREPLRQRLAQLAGCSPEELAICRNATEALDICINGIDLKAGDEVVLSRQDYPNMINMWKQRELREGIRLIWVNLELPSEDEGYLVRSYADAVSDRTRVVHVTHLINWNGQILPVRAIADAVRAKNPKVQVICDSAHAFAQIQFRIPDLGCDYWGTSLHKWLCAPFGTGLLWVKRERIASLWPLMANPEPRSDDIRKFEAQGTRSFPAEQAIGYALDFHQAIGSERKEARLRYLKDYWCRKAKDLAGVRLHTSLQPKYACALAGVSIAGIKPAELDAFLFNKYKIHAVAIDWENIHCVRITPHVYTQLSELDKLILALRDAAQNGVGTEK